jgi:hypothetical protein
VGLALRGGFLRVFQTALFRPISHVVIALQIGG